VIVHSEMGGLVMGGEGGTVESLVGLGRVINDRPKSQTAFVPGFRHTRTQLRTHAYSRVRHANFSPSVSGVRILSSEHQNTEVICFVPLRFTGGFFYLGILSACVAQPRCK